MPDATDDSSELRMAAFAAAAHAQARFGSEPPPPWEPAAPLFLDGLFERRWTWLSVLTIVAALLFWVLHDRATAVESEQPQATDNERLHQALEEESVEDVAPEEAEIAPSAPASTLLVGRHGGLWRIDASQASRLDAVLELARRSGSALHGPVELLAHSPGLNLRWQGTSLAQAWQQVLGSASNYALQCRRERCELWFVAAPSSTQAPMQSAGALPAVALPDGGASNWQAAAVEPTALGIATDGNPTGDAGGSYH